MTLNEHLVKLDAMKLELAQLLKLEASNASDYWTTQQWDDHVEKTEALKLEVYNYEQAQLVFA